jgi:hypothetical protein
MSEAPQTPPTDPPGQPPTGPSGRRTLWTGIGVGAAVVVLAVVLFLVLRDDDSEEASGTTPTTTAAESTTTEETTTDEATTEETTTEETTTAPANQPQRVVVVVQNGQPVGGVVEAEIKQGTQVVLVVRADVEDEVHLHGYDLAAEVAPGRPARIRFRADVAGEFEVELEERVVPIAELVVSP